MDNEPWPAGHFYSAIPDYKWIAEAKEHIVFTDRETIPGINLNIEYQLALLQVFRTYASKFDWPNNPDGKLRYYTNNTFYGAGSGFLLFCMLHHFKPKRLIEVGSGFSSALTLDTAERFNSELELTFIEPYPDRLRKLMAHGDGSRCTVLEKLVQDVPLSHFAKLEEGDILFIDSSHVAKTGSDVTYLYLEVFPILKPGVIVHVHDIYWPFEYPKSWIEKRWAWNEAYFLRAVLQSSAAFTIMLFTNYLAKKHRPKLDGFPFEATTAGSAIWLRRT